jgi:hypothetical protein
MTGSSDFAASNRISCEYNFREPRYVANAHFGFATHLANKTSVSYFDPPVQPP